MAMLNGSSINIDARRAHLLQRFPDCGYFSVDFVSQRRPPETCSPLTRKEFSALWTRRALSASTRCCFFASQMMNETSSLACRLMGGDKSGNDITDGWKMELLDTVCLDNYFTCSQVNQVLQSIDYAETRITATVRMFSRIVNPEDFTVALNILTGAQMEEIQSRLGVLRIFNPKNPTGCYTLELGHQLGFLVAVRLLELYRAQCASGFCSWPNSVCFVNCSLDGNDVDVQRPHQMKLPLHGQLAVTFVDLTPIPNDAMAMHPSLFAAMRSILVNQKVRALSPWSPPGMQKQHNMARSLDHMCPSAQRHKHCPAMSVCTQTP
jgi:Domain of unknown function (DUF4476)